MQEYEKYQELLNQKHKMEEQFQRKGNGFILTTPSRWKTTGVIKRLPILTQNCPISHFRPSTFKPTPKFKSYNLNRSKESETEQKHNAVLQELEDDYEKRLADKARQLEDKVR